MSDDIPGDAFKTLAVELVRDVSKGQITDTTEALGPAVQAVKDEM